MMIIPNCFKPYAGELWYGYVMRLTYANGYTNISEFEKRYLLSATVRNSTKRCRIIPYDAERLSDRIENPSFPDAETIVHMTPYYAVINTKPDYSQAKLAERILSPGYILGQDQDLTDNTVRWCPVCWQEDIRRSGAPYLHVNHNVPYVHVCAKHHIPLSFTKVFTKLKPYEMWQGSTFQISDQEQLKEEVSKAEQAAFLLSGNDLLKKYTCNICGKEFVAHPYSLATGYKCPICNTPSFAEHFKERIAYRYSGKFDVIYCGDTYEDIQVRHTACGHVFTCHGARMIWGNAKKCRCSELMYK